MKYGHPPGVNRDSPTLSRIGLRGGVAGENKAGGARMIRKDIPFDPIFLKFKNKHESKIKYLNQSRKLKIQLKIKYLDHSRMLILQ